ncbi:uncharacterized protein H6S33_003074 [Morchella sextelata]|uniref:uncharacterized protein n=1 Tax=Morchella sextelata TaxID=1174677 RepID=UPI001D04254D|nr:uncharacterized protein H6S33_003074 [Morchella sextelata]KAH0607086.1 hypothetical protein H6S33_003074 [Morchella sextelata]
MFACRSRSGLARLQALHRIPVLSRTKFSTIAPLRQAAPVEDADSPEAPAGTRLPLSLQAIYYEPFRRQPTMGLPVCDLQLRSYSVRNLEFMCDFALRAAYYCHLPASGPVPLPRKTERWTVPRGHFVHKKSQENYERVTYKRLIQIKDGHPETVELWLAFLRKHQYYGVGMKANMYGFDELGVGKRMGVSLETIKDVARPRWSHFGSRKSFETAEKARQLLESPEYKSLSHEDALKEFTEEEHIQKAAKSILEDPRYHKHVEEAKKEAPQEEKVAEQVVMDKIMIEEEQVQAQAVKESLEKAEEFTEVSPKVDEVAQAEGISKIEVEEVPQVLETLREEEVPFKVEETLKVEAAVDAAKPIPTETPEPAPEAKAAPPVEEAPVAASLPEVEPLESILKATAEEPVEAQAAPTTPTATPEVQAMEPTPIEPTPKVEEEVLTPILETKAEAPVEAVPSTPEPTPEPAKAESPVVAPVDVPVSTISETETPVEATQAPASADSPVVEKIITDAKEAKEEVKEVKEESVSPQVTEIKAEEVKEVKETKEEVKVEGEKPKEG